MNINRAILEAVQDSELSTDGRIYELVRKNIQSDKYYAKENYEHCQKKVLLMSGNPEVFKDREEGTHQADNQSEILKSLGVNPEDYYDKDKGISSAVYVKIREYRNGVYTHEKLTISAKIITDKKTINEYQSTFNFKDRAYSYEVKSTVAALRAAFKILKYEIVNKTASKPTPVAKPKLRELSKLRIADAIGYLISHGARSFGNVIYYYNKYGLKSIIENDPYFSKTKHLSKFGKLPSSDYVVLDYYVEEDTDDGYNVNVIAAVKQKEESFRWSNIKLNLDIKPSDNPSSVSEDIIDAIDEVAYDEYKDQLGEIYQ